MQKPPNRKVSPNNHMLCKLRPNRKVSPNNHMLCKLRPPGEVYIICLIGLCLGVGFGTACKDTSKPSEKTPAKTTPPEASVESPPVVRQKPELSFSLRVHESSGVVSELQLQPEAEFEIEPAQRVEVLANQRLADFRVRLMDAQERVLPSDETIVFEDEATRVNIQLLLPLKPANSLVLLVDGQRAPLMSNFQADTYEDFRATLKVRGEPEKPAAKSAAPSKKPKKSTKTRRK